MSEQNQDSSESLSDQSPAERAAAAASILADVHSPAEPEPANNPVEEDRYTVGASEQVMGTTKSSSRKKRGAPPREPAAPSVPAKVKKMLGDGERYRFYKVDKLGSAAMIGDYPQQSLELANNDIELFIQTYLVHEYGPGEYLLKVMNDKGALLKQGTYPVLAARGANPVATPAAGGNMFEQGLVNSATAELRKLQEEMRDQERKERERVEKQNQELQSQMLLTKQDGGNSMSSMFMMMMQQQQMAAAQAAADRRRDEMRREAMEIQARIAAASAPPPMALPPPPPPVDPMAMFTQFATLLKTMAPEKDDRMERYYQDRIRDLEQQRSAGDGGFKAIFEKINEFDEMAQRRYGVKEESTGAEIAKSFVDNFQGNLAALKEVIVAGTTKQLAAAPEAKAPAPPAPDILPDGFLEIITELDDAPDDLERINIVLQSLSLFQSCGNSTYEKLAEGILKSIAEGRKKVVMLTLKQMLGECKKREMIGEDAMTATLAACEAHFEDIRGAVTGEAAAALASKRAQELAPEQEPAAPAQAQPTPEQPPAAEPEVAAEPEAADVVSNGAA